MRFRIFIVAIVLICTAFGMQAPAANATTAILIDAATGQVLHAERADQRWYPASITKLMTAYIAFEILRDRPRLTEASEIALSEFANSQEPTKLWLKTGTRLPLRVAIGAMIVKSANDAAVMVAEGVGGELASFTRFGGCRHGEEKASHFAPAPDPMKHFHARPSGLGAARFDEASQVWSACRYAAFIRRMNATARRLSMTSTVFANPNGLPDARQSTTARDFARLARALVQDFPQYGPIFAARSMRYSRGRLRSYNSLLRTFDGADGMKTGFICAAGYNIVASATRNGRRLIAVVLGWSKASRRNARASALLDHGFRISPTHFGPHDMTLAEMPHSGDGMTPPPDIRASLTSRSCRRGIRYRARKVVVRALEGVPRAERGNRKKVGKVALTGDASKQKAKSKVKSKSKSGQPKPKRVKARKKKRTARKIKAASKKKSASPTYGIAAGAAVSRASQK